MHRPHPHAARAAVVALALALPHAARAADAPARAREVVVVFKTHFDIGYTDMASNVVHRYRTSMIDDALAVVDQNRDLPHEQQFAWTIPGWPLAKILEEWPGQSPGRRARVQSALRDGRFVVHALPFTTHTESLGPEDLVRGLTHASRTARALGIRLPRDAKMTDVPSHTWILPTILRRAGVEFFHIGCNSGSSSPDLPPLFWWIGPDGSRLLTMYSAGGYGTDLAPPPDWPHRTWLALIHTGDNHGPPRPDEIRKLLDRAGETLPGVTIHIGRLSDFADRILAEKPVLPEIRGDMPDTWIHGPMSDPAGARVARNVRPLIAATESLNTQSRLWGINAPDLAPAIADAYEQSLLYGEHTWGGALSWITPLGKGIDFPYDTRWGTDRARGRFERLEASWVEHTNYIETVERLIRPLAESQMLALARAIDGDGPRAVVYNPLPWSRDGLVTLPVRPGLVQALRPDDAPDQVIPVDARGGTIRFVARDVPAMGYRTYTPTRPRVESGTLLLDERASTIESPTFKATIDPARGTVRSLVDKRAGRDLVDPSAPHGLGQLLHEHFDADQVAAYVRDYVKTKDDWAVTQIGKPPMPPATQTPYRAESPSNWSVTWELTPISVAAVAHAHGGAPPGYPVTFRCILYRDLPCADLEITLHEKPPDPWPEAGWICLPFRVARPRFQLGRPGSIIDPATDIVPGSNRHLLAIDTGLTISDPDGRGVGLCPLDGFLVSLDAPGCMRHSHDFIPRKASVFVNLFNNQWTTNFRVWNGGTWTSRIRLWTTDHSAPSVSLNRPSLEARHPLLATFAPARISAAPADRGARLPPARPGLRLSRGGVLVTAFGTNPDDAGTLLLRLWELDGQRGLCRVTLPHASAANRARPIDLRGQPSGAPIPIDGGSFNVDLDPFAPASFALSQD